MIRSFQHSFLALTILCALSCLDPIPPETLTQPGNGSVSGNIKDFCKGGAVEGADVTAKGNGGERRSTSSDASGAFKLANLRPGTWTVGLSRTGYQTLEKSVLVQSDRDQSLALTLTPAYKPTTSAAKLDLLFVVDNSGSMQQEQQALAAAFPQFMSSLMGFKLLLDLRVGVISTDLGAGNLYVDNACQTDGDGGKLLKPASSSTCPVPKEDYIAVTYSDSGTVSSNVPGDQVVQAFSCMVKLGTDGCGFEQHLGSLRKALAPGTNPGFLRKDAALAVVILSDEDDCTAENPQLYDPSQQGLNDPLGPLTSFRCFEFGVSCTCPGSSKCNRFTTGKRAGCKPKTGGYMLDVSKVVTELKASQGPGKLYFAVIGGPADTVEVGVQGSYPTLKPSCSSSAGFAVPAVRLKAVADSLSPASSFDGICVSGLDQTMSSLAVSIAQAALLSPCK